MRFLTAAALAACAATTNAFVDTHPFIYFSTVADPSLDALKNQQLATSESLKSSLTSACPTASNILLVTLPGLNAADFQPPTTFGSNLNKLITYPEYQSAVTISEVAGDIDARDLLAHYKSCGMKAKEVRYTNQWSGKQEPYVENAWDSAAGFGDSARGFKKREKTVTQHSLQSLSSLATQRTDAKSLRERKRTLQLDESRLVELTQHFASSKLESYAVLILGTTGMVPASVAAEDALFKVQQYDKRSGAEFAAKEGGNGTYTSLPLFERYQFFTPGLFMGLGVTLLLLAILSVGIRAISSLQVSYAAFEKEGGPGKKTQ